MSRGQPGTQLLGLRIFLKSHSISYRIKGLDHEMNEQRAAGYIHCSSRWVCVYFSNPTAYPTALKGLSHEMNEQGAARNIHCSNRCVCVYFSKPTAYPTELKGLDHEMNEQGTAWNPAVGSAYISQIPLRILQN